MRTWRCTCGNRLFIGSTQCVSCGRRTGYCPNCCAIRNLVTLEDGSNRCGKCSRALLLCRNAGYEQVCNVCVEADSAPTPSPLCQYCCYTRIIPDLSVAGNTDRWRKLERAKRRVLIGIENVRVPLRKLQAVLPLSFEFKADTDKRVATGHANGVITINIREADDVEREKTRVEFGEPHRTLVGHFRHELGHYFWDLLIKPDRLQTFRRLFGDETNPSYADAHQNYYASGPPADWRSRFVSAYASMHPWEDFAETFQTYLDLRAVLETAEHFDSVDASPESFERMVKQYQSLGIMANEWNRDLGLLDLVPEVFGATVKKKLAYVHRLLSEAATT